MQVLVAHCNKAYNFIAINIKCHKLVALNIPRCYYFSVSLISFSNEIHMSVTYSQISEWKVSEFTSFI